MAAAICVGLAFSAAAQGAEHAGEKVDMKSLPASVQQTINQQARGGQIVQVKREDDANGRWNYEVIVRTNGKESAFEVDPNGKLVKKHSEIKKWSPSRNAAALCLALWGGLSRGELYSSGTRRRHEELNSGSNTKL